MCLQYYKRHTYIKIFIVYLKSRFFFFLKSRFQWDILCFIWQAALLMPTRWISLPTPLASSCLHQFLRSSPSCPLSTWYSSADSSKASYGLWNSASVSLESSVLWMGLATCVPCLISGLLPQFIFSILPPETGVLPWTPVYLARTHTWFSALPVFSLGLWARSFLPAAGWTPDWTSWISETCLRCCRLPVLPTTKAEQEPRMRWSLWKWFGNYEVSRMVI